MVTIDEVATESRDDCISYIPEFCMPTEGSVKLSCPSKFSSSNLEVFLATTVSVVDACNAPQVEFPLGMVTVHRAL